MTTHPLGWGGSFHGHTAHLDVPAEFSTDLASVPRCLTWLFPRYGTHTKAAVLHDYLCNYFRTTEVSMSSGRALLEDRSDADEIFRDAMKQLGVPWARRWLMWSAVSWATLASSIWPGRGSRPVQRRLGQLMAVALLLALIGGVALAWRNGVPAWVTGSSSAWRWLRVALAVHAAFAVIAGWALLAGWLALGRTDRWLVFGAQLGMTVASLSLLGLGLALALLLVVYLFVEDLPYRLKGTRAGLTRVMSHGQPAAGRQHTSRARRRQAVQDS